MRFFGFVKMCGEQLFGISFLPKFCSQHFDFDIAFSREILFKLRKYVQQTFSQLWEIFETRISETSTPDGEDRQEERLSHRIRSAQSTARSLLGSTTQTSLLRSFFSRQTSRFLFFICSSFYCGERRLRIRAKLRSKVERQDFFLPACYLRPLVAGAQQTLWLTG